MMSSSSAIFFSASHLSYPLLIFSPGERSAKCVFVYLYFISQDFERMMDGHATLDGVYDRLVPLGGGRKSGEQPLRSMRVITDWGFFSGFSYLLLDGRRSRDWMGDVFLARSSYGRLYTRIPLSLAKLLASVKRRNRGVWRFGVVRSSRY